MNQNIETGEEEASGAGKEGSTQAPAQKTEAVKSIETEVIQAGAEVNTSESGVVTQGARKKVNGSGKTKGARKAQSTKSKVVSTGAGKSHAVTAKLDAELLRRLTMARSLSGMTESGFLRHALVSYLDNLEQRSVAAEISKAAAAMAGASQSSMAPVLDRLNTLEHRVQQQLGAVLGAIKGLGELLGEPVGLDGIGGPGSTGTGN